MAETFWVTFFATFTATMPAVWLGIATEGYLKTRRSKAAARQFVTDASAPGSVLYNARDWANSIRSNVVANMPLQMSNSVGSAASIRDLASYVGVDDLRRRELMVLADHVERLHGLTDPLLGNGVPAPTPAADFIKTEAEFVGDVASGLIGSLINPQPVRSSSTSARPKRLAKGRS